MAIRKFDLYSKVAGNFSRYDSAFQSWLDQQWKEYNLPDYLKDQFYSNPHTAKYRYYQQNSGGIGSDIMQGLTGDSSFNQNSLQATEDFFGYWNQLQAQAQSNQYNSPANQADLMRQAGQNPNLLGTGDVATDVRNPEPMFGSSFASPSNDLSSVSSALNPILQIAQSYLSLRTGFAQLKGINIQNSNYAASGLASIADFARAAAYDSIKPSDFIDYQADKEGFLNGVLVQAQSLAQNYFGDDYPNYKTARKVFSNVFNEHRSSAVLNHKSFKDFEGIRDAQYHSQILEQDMENGITRSALNLQLLRTQIDSRYARLESELLSNPDYSKLWNDERFASIRASIEKSNETAAQSGFNAEVWSQVGSSDGAVNDASSAILEDFKARISEAIASAKEADLRAADAAVIQAFNDYLSANGAFKTNNAYDAGSKNRTLYRGASARYGAYAEYLPVTLDDLINTTLQIKNFESRGRK